MIPLIIACLISVYATRNCAVLIYFNRQHSSEESHKEMPEVVSIMIACLSLIFISSMIMLKYMHLNDTDCSLLQAFEAYGLYNSLTYAITTKRLLQCQKNYYSK